MLTRLLLAGCADKASDVHDTATENDSASESAEIDCATELWADQADDTEASWMEG